MRHPASLYPSYERCVVYKFPCADCGACYIGETNRHVASRIRKHLSITRIPTFYITSKARKTAELYLRPLMGIRSYGHKVMTLCHKDFWVKTIPKSKLHEDLSHITVTNRRISIDFLWGSTNCDQFFQDTRGKLKTLARFFKLHPFPFLPPILKDSSLQKKKTIKVILNTTQPLFSFCISLTK